MGYDQSYDSWEPYTNLRDSDHQFGEKILIYSFEKVVDYKNKTIDILENFMVENLEEGDFLINIFLKGELVSTTKINLK